MTKLSLIKENSTSYRKQGRFNKHISGATTENQYSLATRLAGNRMRRPTRPGDQEIECHIATTLTQKIATMSAHDTNQNNLIQTSTQENA
jgi:hypothetical protein